MFMREQVQKLFLVVGMCAFLALSYIYFPESIDDAYITLRFSKNVSIGNGPVFNIGERVEGYSNPFWMILLSSFGDTVIPMEMAMKFLGLISGIGSLLITWRIADKWFKSDSAVGAPVILLGVVNK